MRLKVEDKEFDEQVFIDEFFFLFDGDIKPA